MKNRTLIFRVCLLAGLMAGLQAGPLAFGQSRPGQTTAVPASLGDAFSRAGIRTLREPVAPIVFSLPLIGGGNQSLQSLKGQVVVLNFWATWCPPCRQEMPSMERLYTRFRDQGLVLLGVDIRESRESVAAFVKEYGLSFPIALDFSGITSGQYGIQAIPTTYIINRSGNIIAQVIGSIEWDTPAALEAFELLLKDGY